MCGKRLNLEVDFEKKRSVVAGVDIRIKMGEFIAPRF